MQKVSSQAQVNLKNIRLLRKGVAKILTILTEKRRAAARTANKGNKYTPRDLQAKRTRSFRRRLTPFEQKKLTMRHLLKHINVDFIKYGKPAFIGSWLVVLIGVGVVFSKGSAIYGIDFAGGVVMEVRTPAPADFPAIRAARRRTPLRTTWTACRSRWPRTSGWAAVAGTTTGSAPPVTSSRTTCCNCFVSSPWRRQSHSILTTCATKNSRSFAPFGG